jgi:hypothetical protein
MPLDEELKNRLDNYSKNKEYLLPAQDVLIDYSKYKPYLGESTSLNVDQWDDARANAQSSLAKIGNTIGQGVGTFLTATASSGAALVGGGVGLLAEGVDAFVEGDKVSGLDIALNNPVMQGIQEFDKYLKEDLLPVYYTKEQQESLISASTGTDLVNGVGFLLSNIIPSAATTKLLGGLPKLAATAKAGKLESALETAIGKGLVKAEDASKLNLLGKFFEKAPAMTGALVGRLGESAMEANGVYESILTQLNAENEAAQEELEIYGTTNKKIRTPEEIELAAKKGQSDAFYGNMVLAISDLGQQTRWLKPTGLADDIIKQGVGYAVKKRTKGELIGDFMKESLQEAGEEGFQFLVQKGAERGAMKGTSFINEALNAGGELFSTIEGQKSMLLGAVLGGGASAIANKRNAPEKAKQLQQMVNELNSNAGVVTDKYIETPDGKRVINPAFAKQSQTFLKLEELKNEALEQGDIETAELIEKQQFSNLVQSRVQNDKFDDLIDELESLGKTDDVELAQYFGKVPTDAEGNKLSANQMASIKIQEARQIKKMIDNLNTIPQYKSLDLEAKNDFVNHILTQDNLLKSIQQLDGKIASLEATKTFIIPETVGITTKVEETLDPVVEEQIKNLKSTREELATRYDEINKSIKEALKDPSKLNNKVAEKTNKELQTLANQIEAEDNILTETDSKLAELKATEQPFVIPGTEQMATVVDGILVDPETGQELDEELVKEAIKQDIIDTKAKEAEDFTDQEDYQETVDFSDSAKKPNVYSTSTRGYQRDQTGNKVTTFYNNPTNEVAYQKESLFYDIVKWFSKWTNTPGVSKSTYTTRLFIQQPTEAILNQTNNWRRSKGLPALTMQDLESNPSYQLIGMSVLENGKSVSQDILHFHDVDYIKETAIYDRLVEEATDKEGNLDKVKLEQLLKEEKAKITKQRQRIITALKSGKDVQLQIVGKSNGIINYNPKVDGKNQVLPLFSLGDLGGKILKVDKDGKPVVYSNGLGVVVKEDEDSFTIRYEGNKEGKQGYEVKIPKKEFNGYVGQTVFGTVTANGTPYLTKTTQREFTDENLDGMTNLIFHRLTTGENKFKINNQEFTIVGKAENRGILDSLLNWGFRPEQKEKQIQFNKDGSLVIGKNTIQPTDPQAKEKIKKFLQIYKNYPSFTAGTLDNKIAFPTEIIDGKANADIQTISKFLFAGNAPLIGTNVNSEVPFINSYFTFKTGPEGLELNTEEQVEVETSYMDELDKTFGEMPNQSEAAEAETIGELTDEGEIKPITTIPATTNTKADIERRRQEELFNVNNFIELQEDEGTLKRYINNDLYYRSIGKEGLIDALTNKILRQKGKDQQINKYSSVYFGQGIKGFEEASDFADKTTFPIIVIVPKNNMLNAEMQETYKQQNVKTKKSVSTENVNYFTIIENKPYLLNIALAENINAKYDAELAALEGEIDTTQEVQTRLNEDLGVTSKITTDAYLNGLHYLQTEDGKYYVIPDSNAAGYGDESAKEVTKEQIIKPFRTEAEWEKVGTSVDTKVVETKPVTTELNKAVEENDKACTTNNPAKEGKPGTLNNQKFTDTNNDDWD